MHMHARTPYFNSLLHFSATCGAKPVHHSFVSHVNGSSDFTFNFATAWFPAPGSRTERGAYVSDTAASASEVAVPTTEGLVVRVVECSPNHHPCPNATHPEWSVLLTLPNHCVCPILADTARHRLHACKRVNDAQQYRLGAVLPIRFLC